MESPDELEEGPLSDLSENISPTAMYILKEQTSYDGNYDFISFSERIKAQSN